MLDRGAGIIFGSPAQRGREEGGPDCLLKNVQVLRSAYEAFARQDVPAAMAAFDESIEWSAPESLPFGGTYRGQDGVGGFFGQLPQYWEDLVVAPVEFIDGGDTIVVIARCHGTGAGGRLISATSTFGGCATARRCSSPNGPTRHARWRRWGRRPPDPRELFSAGGRPTACGRLGGSRPATAPERPPRYFAFVAGRVARRA